MNYKKNILIFLILIFLDQISKHLIRSNGGFYICNFNSAFGISLPTFLFWFLWIGMLIIFIWAIYKNFFLVSTFYLILILAGAISNLIDRLARGCVIDFIDLKFWPVFNLADLFIFFGAIMIIASYLKKEKKPFNFFKK